MFRGVQSTVTYNDSIEVAAADAPENAANISRDPIMVILRPKISLNFAHTMKKPYNVLVMCEF